MPTKAQLVREALITEVLKVAGIGHVSSQVKQWTEEGNLPAVYVILDNDDSKFEPTQSKTVDAFFRLATLLRSDNPQDAFDDLRGAIEAEIEDDPSLGGLADVAFVSGVGQFATATTIAGQVYVRNIFVDVTYKHPRGQP